MTDVPRVPMSEIPRCEICQEPGVAMVNGHGMCGHKDHINLVIGRNVTPIKELINLVSRNDPHYKADARYQPPDDDVRPTV